MPQEKIWSDPAMEAQALAALDRTAREFHGDPSRTYLTGLSLGGYGTWDRAAKYPGRFAAYAPICGGIHGPQKSPHVNVGLANDPKLADPDAETARRIGKTPVWIFHGDADPSVPLEESRKMYAAAASGKCQREVHGVSRRRPLAEPGLVPCLLEQHLQH